MKLADIQALRPPEGADSDTIAASIELAVQYRQDAAEQQRAATAIRADVLAGDDKALIAAQRDTEAARLAVERFDALLPLLRADYTAATGRETVAELRSKAEALHPMADELRRWQDEDYPKIAELIGVGLEAHHALMNATQALIVRTEAEYARPEVAAAGKIGVDFPNLAEPFPVSLFPNFELSA